MPTYSLQCTVCGHKFEDTHRMEEPHPKKCPNPDCGKRNKIQQLFDAAPAFHTHYSPMHPRVHRGRGH